MELLYINILNIFTINVIDIDKLLPINSKTYKNFFYKKNLHYRTSFDSIINNDTTINILVKNKKTKFNEIKLAKYNLKFHVDYSNLELYDVINNIYYKFNISNTCNILTYILCYLQTNISLCQKDGQFLLPSGYKKRLDLTIRLNNTYFISKGTDNTIKVLYDNKILSIKCKKIKTITAYFLAYIESLLKLKDDYFLDSWFYSKYINTIKNFFSHAYIQKNMDVVSKKLINNALQRRFNNELYNRCLFFISNQELYNTYLIDLYKYKSDCKQIQKYLSLEHNIIHKNIQSKIQPSSEEYFISKISYSTWLESFENGDYFGVLINGNFKRNCLSGHEPFIYVKNLNQCLISIDDYIESSKFYYDKYKKFDDGGKKTDCLISYDGIGKGNIFLPLYICEEHFNLVKLNIKSVTGINLYNNPIQYVKKNLLIYISYISEFIFNTFANPTFNNNTWIPILFNYILFVKEMISCYYTHKQLETLYNTHLTKVKFNINFTIGLSVILSFNPNYRLDINHLITKLVEEMIRIKCGKHYNDITNDYKNFVTINYTKYNNFLSPGLQDAYTFLINPDLFSIFNKLLNSKNDIIFIKKIWSIYHFHIKIFDKLPEIFISIKNNYGILSTVMIDNIKTIITSNKFPEQNETIHGVINPLFQGHILYNKQLITDLPKICKKINAELFTDEVLYAMFLQGFLQRNYNKRKLALKNKNLYFSPITESKQCIFNCLKMYIKIWSCINYKDLYNQLSDTFKRTTNTFNILGIYYILHNLNKLEEFIIEVIKDGTVRMLRFKLDLLNGKNVSNDMIWLLPIDPITNKKKMFELKLLSWNISKRDNNK